MKGGKTVGYLAFMEIPGVGAEQMYMTPILFLPNPSQGSSLQKPKD